MFLSPSRSSIARCGLSIQKLKPTSLLRSIRSIRSTGFGSGPKTANATNNFIKYTVCTIPIISFGLGCWQIRRLKEKLDFISFLESKAGMPAKPFQLNDVETPLDFATAHEYEKYRLKGEYEQENEVHIHPRRNLTVEHSEYGAYVLVPFRLEGGERVMVNQGFVPRTHFDAESRKDAFAKGPIEIEAVVTCSDKGANRFTKNSPEKRQYHSIDVLELAVGMNCYPLLFTRVHDPDQREKYPLGGQTVIDVKNQHMEYIFTWFGLCIATTFMAYYFLKKSNKRLSKRMPITSS